MSTPTPGPSGDGAGVEIGKKTFSGIVSPLRRDPAAEARKIRNSG